MLNWRLLVVTYRWRSILHVQVCWTVHIQVRITGIITGKWLYRRVNLFSYVFNS